MYKASTVYKRKKMWEKGKLYEKYQEEKNYNKGKLMCAMAKIKKQAKYEHSYH